MNKNQVFVNNIDAALFAAKRATLELENNKAHDDSLKYNRLLIDCFEKAQRFISPEQLMLSDELFNGSWDDIKLPYDYIVISHVEDLRDKDSKKVPIEHVTLCAKYKYFKHLDLINKLDIVEGEDSDNFIFIVTIRKMRNIWSFTPVCTVLQRDPATGDVLRTSSIPGPENVQIFNRVRLAYGFSDQEIVNSLTISSAYKVLSLLSALNCENVEVETVKRSKLHIKSTFPKSAYEYKQLKIKLGVAAEKSEPKGGTHASPRTHLRRGHVRRYANGKTVWIEASVINASNDAGLISKDYVIEA